jgi:cell division septal protein FtsQ
MPLPINRKIFIYLFIFFILGTYTNKKFSNLSFPKIDNYQITGLSEDGNNKIFQDLSYLQNQNLFFLKKNKILKVINSHNEIEKYSVFKNYPSNLDIVIERTDLLALTKKNGQDFLIGLNGKLIKPKNFNIDLPFVYGNIDILEFLKLKKIIDNSDFDYTKIKNLYYFKSKRWDIETKDNLLIKLPITKLEKSFELILKMYKEEEFKDFKTIDLRQDNLVILNE